MLHKFKTFFFVSILAGVLIGVVLVRFQDAISGNIVPSLIKLGWVEVQQSGSWVALPFDQLIKNADIIFIGEVVEISATRWNQDSGEDWVEESFDKNGPGEFALQFHTIQFKVTEFINATPEYNDKATVEVTVIGQSPLDGSTEYNLQKGDIVLFFARKGEIVWRGNEKREVISLLVAPSLSYFIQRDDSVFEGQIINILGAGEFSTEQVSLSLEELTRQIEDIKASEE